MVLKDDPTNGKEGAAIGVQQKAEMANTPVVQHSPTDPAHKTKH